MKQVDIDRLVEKYLGIPYKHGGRNLDGLDCLGLVYCFYRDAGINVPDGDGEEYPTEWWKTDPERYIRGIKEHGKEVSVEQLRPLDLVYFRMGGQITHAGIMVDMECFIHTLEDRAVGVEHLHSGWKRRLAGARRFE